MTENSLLTLVVGLMIMAILLPVFYKTMVHTVITLRTCTGRFRFFGNVIMLDSVFRRGINETCQPLSQPLVVRKKPGIFSLYFKEECEEPFFSIQIKDNALLLGWGDTVHCFPLVHGFQAELLYFRGAPAGVKLKIRESPQKDWIVIQQLFPIFSTEVRKF